MASLDAVFFSPCAGAVGPQPAPQSDFAADHLLLATAPKMLPTTRPATPTPPTAKAIVLRSMPEPPEPAAAGARTGARGLDVWQSPLLPKTTTSRLAWSCSASTSLFVTDGMPLPREDERVRSRIHFERRPVEPVRERRAVDRDLDVHEVVARDVLRREDDRGHRLVQLVEPLRAVVPDDARTARATHMASFSRALAQFAGLAQVLRGIVRLDALLLRRIGGGAGDATSETPSMRAAESAWRWS